MPGCRTSNFDRSFCVGSPARLLEKTLQVLCTRRTGRTRMLSLPPVFIGSQHSICWYAAVVAAGGGAARASGRGASCTQLTKRKPVASWPSSLIETVPICQLPFFTLQSMGYWIPIKGSYTSWATLALVGSIILSWWAPAKPDRSSAVLA